MSASTLLALDRRSRDGLGDNQEIAEIQRRVPARIVFTVPGHSRLCRSLCQLVQSDQRLLHLPLVADDPDQFLHEVLQILLDLERVFGGVAALEGIERDLRRRLDLTLVEGRGAARLRERRGMLAGELAEDQQIRQRVAAEAIGAVDARRAFAGGEQPRNAGHLRVGVHPDPAHHVVRRRSHLHRRRRDVEARELLELVVHARQLAADVIRGVRELLLDPRDVEVDAAVRCAAAFADLAHDGARDVIAGEELGRPPGVLVPLGVAPAFLGVVSRLAPVVVGDVVEHEAAPLAVAKDAPLATHAFGHEDALHARRPDHAGRMELHELHVDELGAGAIGQGVAVPGALPAVAGDAVGAPDPSGREHDRLGAEGLETAALALVAEGAGDASAVEQQRDHGEFHVHVEAVMDAVILQRADHLEAGAVADVRQARVLVAAEVALQDAAVSGAIEDRAPRLELTHPIRRLPGVQLRHPPVVHVLAAAHGVGEVHLPAVALVDVRERRRDAAFGHHRMRLAQQGLAEEADFHTSCRGFDRRPESGSAGADDEHVVLVGFVAQMILQSVSTPIEQRRT